MSFTDLMRMLKDKNLNKIPKIIINEIITYINRKKKYNTNVLVGVEEAEFNDFLITFVNLHVKMDTNSKDVPFGFKIEEVILAMLSG
jgi:hypothetical protein